MFKREAASHKNAKRQSLKIFQKAGFSELSYGMVRIRNFVGENLFIGEQESEMEWFWPFEPFDHSLNIEHWLKSKLKLPPLQKYFLPESSPWCVINEFFYLKKKWCFVLEISSFLCFYKIHKFQNLWRHHRHCCMMEVTLLLISFESYVLSKRNLVKY